MLAEGQPGVAPVFPLAALPFAPVPTSTTAFLLAANPHQGVRRTVPIWEPGFLIGNHQSTLGLPVCLYDSGRRSRSTAKERDAETGLDYFEGSIRDPLASGSSPAPSIFTMGRYYSSPQGRFTTPDIPLWDQNPLDPQSWNLFSYGRNNPLMNIDPTGRTCVTVTHGDGTSNQADNGDSKGCEAAGVKASQDPNAGTTNSRDDQRDIQAQEFNYNGTTNTLSVLQSDVPIYGLSGQGAQVLQAAGKRATHDMGCTGLGFTVSGSGAAGFASSLPTIDKPFSQGGTPRTSAASEAFRNWTNSARGGPRLPAFEGGPFTGRPIKFRPTNSVGGFWARWLGPVSLDS